MPIYKVNVTEVREYQSEYTIEADNEDEAQAKAKIGDTLSEDTLRMVGVNDRQTTKLEEVIALDPTTSVKLEFHPEVWVNKMACSADAEGSTEWLVDKSKFLQAFPDSMAWDVQDHDRDHSRFEGLAPKWIREWSGPFEVSLAEGVDPWV